MAKNISLLGADYPGVPAVQLPQTGGGTATFYDLTWELVYNGNPTDDLEVSVPDLTTKSEMLVMLISNGWGRQSITYPIVMISENLICFPDFYFAGSRLYLGITRISNTKIKFSSTGASGASTWANTSLMIFIR